VQSLVIKIIEVEKNYKLNTKEHKVHHEVNKGKKGLKYLVLLRVILSVPSW